MPKLPDYSSQDKAFLMYSAGIKLADIAKELNITPNTLSSWKKSGDWDNKITSEGSLPEQIIQETKELSQDGDKITEVLQKAVTTAIEVDKVKPRKWKDVLDTLAFLSRGQPKTPTSKGKSTGIKEIEDIPDVDLDKEIESLSNLIKIEEDEAEIIVYKNGAIKTN